MKAICSNIILAVFTAVIFYSCTSNEQKDNEPEVKWEITNTDTYAIDSSLSTVHWNREVDNKKVNKKVKLFGSYVDVTMENVQFSSEGEFVIDNGELININDKWNHGILELDFSALKLYSEESEKFFVATEYPRSTLKIDSIRTDTVELHYLLNSSLSILDSTKNMVIPVEIQKDSLNNISLKGHFYIQTLEWPLKENPDPTNVRKDEITINLNLVFSLLESKTDSVIVD